MNRTSIDILPDEVLGVILKLVADFLVPANCWDKPSLPFGPFPILAGRVSRRWRSITLSHPEIWTTIRISRHSITRKLAAVFVKRSEPYPLDISINLECYVYKGGRPYDRALLSLSRVLAIVGPHVGRWRTFALRGHESHVQDITAFLRNSPVPAAQLEYVHLSAFESFRFLLNEPIAIPGGQALHSFRLDYLGLDEEFRLSVALLKKIKNLDFTMPRYYSYSVPFFQELLGSGCCITTLILRRFQNLANLNHPIAAYTIKLLAISFVPRDFYFPNWKGIDSIETLTKTFRLPNLERLEIIVQSPPEMVDFPDLTHLQPLGGPPFPNLRALRLEGICITPRRLGLLQILSREITELELINTSGNHHLLSRCRGGDAAPWPFLHSVIVEGAGFTRWLPGFVGMRAALGPDMALARVILPPFRATLPPELAVICSRGISRGLIDGLGRGFFADDLDLRPVDFEFVEPAFVLERRFEDLPDEYWFPRCLCPNCRLGTVSGEAAERVDMEIEEALKTGPALARMMDFRKESKRQKKQSCADTTGKTLWRSAKQRRTDITEDFYVV
ncbi:hypothetical protein K438DRAFT_1880415 [Mycena galopus ATCC 62051]|nr:hypothetical protein K438DRAFT_1880415 [Mycena galopus ATCC 62051]